MPSVEKIPASLSDPESVLSDPVGEGLASDTGILGGQDTPTTIGPAIQFEAVPLPRHDVILETNPDLVDTKYRARAEDVEQLFTADMASGKYKDFLIHLERPVKFTFADAGKVNVREAYFSERANNNLDHVFEELKGGKSISGLLAEAKEAKGAEQKDKLRALETFGARLLHVKAPADKADWERMSQAEQVQARLAERVILEVEMAIVDIKLQNRSSFTSAQKATFTKHFEGYQKNLDISERFRQALAVRAGLLRTAAERKPPVPVDLDPVFAKPEVGRDDYPIDTPIEPASIFLEDAKEMPAPETISMPDELRERMVTKALEERKLPERLQDRLFAMVEGDDENTEAEMRFIENMPTQMQDLALEREDRSTWDRFFKFNLLRKFEARRQVVGFGRAFRAAFSPRMGNAVDNRIGVIRKKVAANIDRLANGITKNQRARAQYSFLAKWLQK